MPHLRLQIDLVHSRVSVTDCILLVLLLLTSNVDAADLVRDSFGGIVRGNPRERRLALVFTGDERGDSTEAILDALKQRKQKASLFVTGNFLRQPDLRRLVLRAITEGHYVGPHSDKHLLYASWKERTNSLVTQAVFTADLKQNIEDLRRLGALGRDATIYFIPPFEQFNRDQVEWSRKMEVTLINFTPGSGSNRDYAPEGDTHFVPSQRIYNDLLAYEQREPHGLNGFILLLHLGSGRRDPFHPRLGPLCDELTRRGYSFVRIDELLGQASQDTLQ